MNPQKYDKIYFMATALYWYLEYHTLTGAGYDDNDIRKAMDEIGVPDENQKAVLELFYDEVDSGNPFR